MDSVAQSRSEDSEIQAARSGIGDEVAPRKLRGSALRTRQLRFCRTCRARTRRIVQI